MNLISVIVPVYNVEPYLRECLNSIIAQTYRDIEIILVDDGSTDGCSAICDEYSCRDNRIAVYHTENHGLSAARNLGIENAHSEWLMFVDSDDWVEPQFCELPYRTAAENNADMVIFGLTLFGSDEKATRKELPLSGEVSARKAFETGHPAAWNKLYHQSLFETIRYPEGRIHEDIATTHKLIYKAKRILFLNECLYNYRYREDSITRRRDEQKYYDKFLACMQRYDDLLSYGYPKEKLEEYRFKSSLHYLMRTEPSDDPLYLRAEEIVTNYNGSLDGLKAHERNAIKIWRLNKTLFHNYYRDKGCKYRQRH